MQNKKSFLVYTEWRTLINSLPDEKRLQLYDLIFSYNGLEYDPDIKDEHIAGIFEFILSKIKENDLKFREKSEKARKAINERWRKYKELQNTPDKLKEWAKSKRDNK